MKLHDIMEAPGGKRGFDNEKKELGEVPFLTTSEADTHVKKIVAAALAELHAAGQKTTEKELWHAMLTDSDYESLQKSATISPILYETIAKNAIEQALFKLVGQMQVKDAPKFKMVYFNDLVDDIRANHADFMHLRNWVTKKYLSMPRFIITPSPTAPAYVNSCDTACATPDGIFAFNKNFMQKLLNFAFLKGLKPKGDIYVSNGGEVPDEYAYIEFLILHELMHYKHADFHYQKKLNVNPKIINYVGDYRSNYLLVKSGYEQLPIGLYSDHINYDRQLSYKEMVKIVTDELNKFPKPERDKMEKMLDDLTDEHPEEGGDSGDDGESGESGGDSQGGDPQDGEGEGEPQDGKGKGEGDSKDGKDGKPSGKTGTESGDMSDEELYDEIDRQYKETEDSFKKAAENKANKKQGDESGQKPSGGRGVTSNFGKQNQAKETTVKPAMNWRELLRKMFSEAQTETVEDTYTRIHRNASASVGLAAVSSKPAALKAGERTQTEEILKVAFVVDSSGSMGHVVGAIYKSIAGLFSQNLEVAPEFMLMQFSEGHTTYACNMKKNVAVKATPQQYVNGVDFTKNGEKLNTVFSRGEFGATNFTKDITSKIAQLTSAGFNVMVFSDWDVLHGENFAELKRAVAVGGKKFFVVLDSIKTFQAAVELMPAISNNISCI
jgi:predicted metal-dependent peptidase